VLQDFHRDIFNNSQLQFIAVMEHLQRLETGSAVKVMDAGKPGFDAALLSVPHGLN
jgi:hypothetical protein